MVRKNKKIVEKEEQITENIELEQLNEVNEMDDFIENPDIPDENEEIIEEIPQEIPQEKPNGIKEILKQKKQISEKQKRALEQNRKLKSLREKEKKDLVKKFNELKKYEVDIDNVIENAKNEFIKKQYHKLTQNDNIIRKKTEKKIIHEPIEEVYEQEPISNNWFSW